MTLRGSTDRRVARHVCHGVWAKRADRNATAAPRRRMGSLDASVPGTDDNHIELRQVNSCEEGHGVVSVLQRSFSDTEPLENMREQIVRRAMSHHFIEGLPRRLEIRQNKLLRRIVERRLPCTCETYAGALEQRDMPGI